MVREGDVRVLWVDERLGVGLGYFLMRNVYDVDVFMKKKRI